MEDQEVNDWLKYLYREDQTQLNIRKEICFQLSMIMQNMLVEK